MKCLVTGGCGFVGSALAPFGPLRWARPGSGWYSRRMIRQLGSTKYRCALGSVYPLDAELGWAWMSERYVLAQPLKIPTGSLLKYKGVFDNSAENPLNPNPDKEVYWSEQSWDEMFSPFLQFVKYSSDAKSTASPQH